MSNYSLPRGQPSSSFGRNDLKPISVRRSSFRIHHYPNNTQISSIGSSPRARPSPRYSFSNSSSIHDGSMRESPYSDYHSVERVPPQRRRILPVVPKSSGLLYTSKARKELSSIDKINDITSNGLICAGKTHLGYYKFVPEDRSIVCMHDFMATGASHSNSFSPNFKKRSRQTKLSTIADIKTGFHNHKNYIAVCSNSTVISVYDINKTSNLDNPFVADLSEHTRSINSLDFNTVQTNLIISGGQDGCIKIWDLRSNSLKSSRKCDVNINTASDSIRDVKWMPFQNYVSTNQQDFKGGSNAGFKFASIHDSGLLLNFDLRQPSQIEKRINAHSGPGLCLSWHPNLDYIATGGRDGKCCLWYVGDTPQYDNTSNYASSSFAPIPHSTNVNASANFSALPETTLNTGAPVTKLKFRPSYEKKVLNSLLALSPMSDDAALNIYSLARKYIPKHVLHTSSQTLGLVWWDDKLIFDIDKENHISGWDISQEPTILDNLPKCVTSWRDIEGNGLLFVDQDRGSYEVQQSQLSIPDDNRKAANHRISVNSLSTTNIGSNSGLIGSIKKGISHTTLSSYTGERPSFHKAGMSFGGKSPSIGLSHNVSALSSSPFNSQNEFKYTESPTMVSLDLPYIFSNMRISHLRPDRNMFKSPEVVAIRESPVKVFKFLARELEFSGNYERKEGETRSLNQPSSLKDEDIKEDLMKRFGLSENTTWAALVNKKSEQEISTNREAAIKASKDLTQFDAKPPGKKTYNSERASVPVVQKKSALTESINELTMGTQQKVDLLLDLIPICSHNASVYSYIDDLPNFKVWLLIRDSLLWDLKTISSNSPLTDQPILKEEFQDNINGFAATGEMVNPGCSSGVTSGISSFVEEVPQTLCAESEDFSKRQKDSAGISKLKQQLMSEKRAESTEGPEHTSLVSNENLKDTQKFDVPFGERRQNSNDTDTIVTDEDEEDNTSDQHSSGAVAGTTSIPIIHKRRQRPSFIDTFMTDVRSPTEAHAEKDFLSKSRRSHSFSHSSPTSKISSLQSLTSGTSPFATLKKMAGRPDLVGSPASKKLSNYGLTKVEHMLEVESSTSKKEMGGMKLNKSKGILPPWNTKKLIRQLYQQAVEMGNVLLAVNILLLFQNIYHVASTEVVKNSLAQFTSILHQYELFEISAAILKYCPWDDIMNSEGGQSLITLFCDRCGKVISNESSKEKFTLEAQKLGNDSPLENFGHWYCDSCKKPNSLCVMCELPMKHLTMAMLECGHEGHFECLKNWFLDEGMTECPGGCSSEIVL